MICTLIIIIVFSLAHVTVFSKNKESTGTSVFLNDEKLNTSVFSGNSEYKDYYLDSYVPLEMVLNKMGIIMTKEDSNSYKLIGTDLYAIIKLKGSTLECDKYPDNSFHEPKHSDYCEYYLGNQNVYIPADELADIVDGQVVQKSTDVYLYTSDYYYSHCVVNKHIGNLVEIDVYVNNEKIGTPVYKNLDSPAMEGPDNLSDYVLIAPIFEEIGAKVSFENSSTVVISSNTVGNYKILIGEKIYKYKDSSFNNARIEEAYDLSDSYLVNDKVVIPFSTIRYIIDGSLKQDDYHSMYLYSSDFERTDIPETLEECYSKLDSVLSESEKKVLKDSSKEQLASYHFSLGLWIRNNWIRPTDSRIAKVFLDKGIPHPDDMSKMIIEGYYNHLNGKPYKINNISNKTPSYLSWWVVIPAILNLIFIILLTKHFVLICKKEM